MKKTRFRNVLLVLGTASLALVESRSALRAEENQSEISSIVELFTSQGCLSCPPADELLRHLAVQDGVLALAYHVDYWDYIGWRDRFGSPQNTQRQKDYAEALGLNAIYTPQIVVNGRAQAVGSHEPHVRNLLARTRLAPAEAPAHLSMTQDGSNLTISATPRERAGYGAAKKQRVVLMLVTYDQVSHTRIDKGENAGLEIANVHSVLGWRVLGTWSGASMTVDIPLSMLPLGEEGDYGCAALMQAVTPDGNPGPILAATVLEMKAD